MGRLAIIEPHLSDYSCDTFMGLLDYCDLDFVFSPTPGASGFGAVTITNPRARCIVIPTLRPFRRNLGMFQAGIAAYLFRERPGAIILNANPRYLSFWNTLLLGRLLGIPVYAHGHGVFKKRKISYLYRLMMNSLLRLSSGYICYAPIVRDTFVEHGFSGEKLSVADNSIINHFPVRPSEKNGNELGILFTGRLREGSNIALLARVIERFRMHEGIPLTLHIIGDGGEAERLRKDWRDRHWLTFYGAVYEHARLREISLSCFAGCYPGNAGLSVVHMMSLSLPVLTHSEMQCHQGPEPSFVEDGISGMLFNRRSEESSLYQGLRSLVGNREKLTKMQNAAYEKYQSLVDPPLAARFWSIVSSGLQKGSQLPADTPLRT